MSTDDLKLIAEAQKRLPLTSKPEHGLLRRFIDALAAHQSDATELGALQKRVHDLVSDYNALNREWVQLRDTVERVRQEERDKIAKDLSHVANKVFHKQEKEYPSNLLDVLAFWVRGLKGSHVNIEKWFPVQHETAACEHLIGIDNDHCILNKGHAGAHAVMHYPQADQPPQKCEAHGITNCTISKCRESDAPLDQARERAIDTLTLLFKNQGYMPFQARNKAEQFVDDVIAAARKQP